MVANHAPSGVEGDNVTNDQYEDKASEEVDEKVNGWGEFSEEWMGIGYHIKN